MIRYVPSSVATELSAALWALSRPVRSADDTQFLFPWVTALNGSQWLAVKDDYTISVHPDADFAPIATLLQPWIERGELPGDTNTQLAALVESLRGSRLMVYDAFPQLFKDMSKTHAEMIAAGLLAEPTEP